MLWEEGSMGSFGEQKLVLDKSIRQFYLSRPQQSDRDDFNVELSGNKIVGKTRPIQTLADQNTNFIIQSMSRNPIA